MLNWVRAIIVAVLAGGVVTVGPASRAASQDVPRVVVSIKPVHSLIAGVMQGLGEPVLLVEGAASPHSYQLRPSQARALAAADLVIWMGARLESFLVKPLEVLVRHGRVVTLYEDASLHFLPARAGGTWHHSEGQSGHGRGDGGEHEHQGALGDGGYELHVWLDPENAKRIVEVAVTALAEADPANAPRYAENGRRVIQRLETLDATLAARLAPVRRFPYVVFHDAYHHLEHRYALNAVGSISISPDRTPGARRLFEIRASIAAFDVHCVFSEPQFPPALAETVVAGTSAHLAELDPLGAAIPAGPDAYFHLMRSLADALTGCLSEFG
jgi:zinc transport system substrate-binding protein